MTVQSEDIRSGVMIKLRGFELIQRSTESQQERELLLKAKSRNGSTNQLAAKYEWSPLINP